MRMTYTFEMAFASPGPLHLARIVSRVPCRRHCAFPAFYLLRPIYSLIADWQSRLLSPRMQWNVHCRPHYHQCTALAQRSWSPALDLVELVSHPTGLLNRPDSAEGTVHFFHIHDISRLVLFQSSSPLFSSTHSLQHNTSSASTHIVT